MFCKIRLSNYLEVGGEGGAGREIIGWGIGEKPPQYDTVYLGYRGIFVIFSYLGLL